jgi:hypothetical protein
MLLLNDISPTTQLKNLPIDGHLTAINTHPIRRITLKIGRFLKATNSTQRTDQKQGISFRRKAILPKLEAVSAIQLCAPYFRKMSNFNRKTQHISHTDHLTD